MNTGDRSDAANRVTRSHAQTRATLRLAIAFLAAGVAAALVAALTGVDRWLALHLFLAGGAVLAISAVSLMLTVTWSAAPAPPDRWVSFQRCCTALGAAGIALGRSAGLPEPMVGLSGTLYLLGLAALAALLVVTVRSGPKRRFDSAVASYLAAVCSGLVGAALGLTMALTNVSTPLRNAHVTANALGLVGLTIGGTLPYFASTVGRSRMNRRATDARLRLTTGWQTVMVALGVAALVGGATAAAAVAFAGYSLGIAITLAWMPALTRRQLEWAGPRLIALWAGCAWWIIATGVTAWQLRSGQPAFADRWVIVLVVAGYGQIMWGSLAYLLPMLRGGGHVLLSSGFATTRSWPGLVAANTAGVALAMSWDVLALTAACIWVIDGAIRVALIGTRRADRPAPATTPAAEPAPEDS